MKRAITIALFAAAATAVHAASQLGIEIYPSAKEDAAVAKMVKQKLKIDAHTYRTSDDVAKVTEFYKKQATLTQQSATKKGAMFTSKTADVTIQRPWLDMDTGKMNDDTLISIVGKK